jgi:hypothetical protein
VVQCASGPVTEDEVIACFLRAELTSERYGRKLRTMLARDGEAIDVLASPDLDDAEANRFRRGFLDEHRAFERREGLFAGFPLRVDWCRAALEPEEVLAIRYINWDWWLRISGGTRSAVEASKRIRRGEVAGVSADEHAEIAAALHSPTPPPELIAVTKLEHRPLVLVEGHVRLTAYALFPEFLPDELELYLGIAEDMAAWSEF